MKRISLRTKFILLCLASIALLGFVLATITTVTINTLKEQIISDAVDLARGQGRRLSRQIEQLMLERGVRSPTQLDETDLESIQDFFMNVKDEVIVSAKFYDPASQTSLELYAELPVEVPQDALRPLSVPIQREGRDVGELHLGVSEEMALQRMRLTGGRITAYMVALSVALFVLMILTFFLLWNAFRRYMQLTAENEQQERMAYIGTLAGGLAHEIRNPLNAININLDTIREEVEDPREDSPKRTHELVRLLQTEIGQLNETLNNFLSFAMPKPPVFEPCDLCALIGETIALMEPHFKRHEATLESEMPRSLIVTADAGRLRQVFWNVMLNALQAMEESEKKELKITVEAQAPRVRIRFRDTGCGIPKKDWDQVFEVFHSRRSEGSGFGLAIARRIVEDHRGEIGILESSEQGTTIEIVLPMEPGKAEKS